MAYIADLVTPNQVIFFFMPDFSIPGLKKSQEFIATLDVDKIIFSHSAKEDPLAPGTKEDVTFFVKYLDDIQAAVGRTTNRSTLSGHVTSVLISDWLSRCGRSWPRARTPSRWPPPSTCRSTRASPSTTTGST